jgi:hypothetical protein
LFGPRPADILVVLATNLVSVHWNTGHLRTAFTANPRRPPRSHRRRRDPPDPGTRARRCEHRQMENVGVTSLATGTARHSALAREGLPSRADAEGRARLPRRSRPATARFFPNQNLVSCRPRLTTTLSSLLPALRRPIFSVL